jgi:hypothetical protein
MTGCASSEDPPARYFDPSSEDLQELLESSDERLDRYSRTCASRKLKTFPLSSCELLACLCLNTRPLTDDDPEVFTFSSVWIDEVPASVKFTAYIIFGHIISAFAFEE